MCLSRLLRLQTPICRRGLTQTHSLPFPLLGPSPPDPPYFLVLTLPLPAVPFSSQIWPEGDNAESVGTLLTGTFHPYAGSPPTPLQPLRVDLSATTIASRLEPDENTDLGFACRSTDAAAAHVSYTRVVTLSNLQSCPLLFRAHTEGPFELVAVTPSAPQVRVGGTAGLCSEGAHRGAARARGGDAVGTTGKPR